MKNLRRISQILFLALFFYLFIQTEYKGSDELGFPVKFFLDFDPLIALSVLLATHAVKAVFLFSLITITVTIFFGRVFCGWVCPLGTMNTIVGWFRMRRGRPTPDDGRFPRLRPVKYFILVFILVAAVFGWNSAGILDPISLTIRSLAIGYNPGVNRVVRSILDAAYAIDLPGISPAADAVYSTMVGTILAFEQPVFRQMIPIALIFSVILGLNLLAPRFWCRYLCPLGAMLGIIGARQMMARVDVSSEKCVSCGTCNRTCQGDATPFPPGQWASRECLGAAALLSVPIVALGEHRERTHPELIRPPGALPEKDFVKTCVKCGECMKVCLTNGLQPTFHQAGLEGLWTPILVPKLGYCEYHCNLCSQVCPTGAIQEITLKEKQKTKIGLATFDRSRCIPYTYNRNCGVCEEHCPAKGKAIRFEDEESIDQRGRPFVLKKPYMVPQICIGCGICENKCPVVDIPAIRVSPINESRHDARLFL
jgi:MauM/NapG family ferredoxin protein